EIKNLQRSLGVTSVYVTHDQLEAMTLADMLVVMNAGVIEQQGAPLDIYEKPASIFVASFIGAPPMNLLSLTDGERGVDLADGSARGISPPQGAVALGCRPEGTSAACADSTGGGALSRPAWVRGVGPVGAESFLHCAAAGWRIIVRVVGRVTAQPGDSLRIMAPAE